jgi:mono/diheme cytochrome c family protein
MQASWLGAAGACFGAHRSVPAYDSCQCDATGGTFQPVQGEHAIMSETTRSPKSPRFIAGAVAIALGALVAIVIVYHQYGGNDAISRGRWAAETHCGGCHDVSPEAQADRRSGVPSFVLLARSGASREQIATFLTRQHRAMPPFRLTAEERENVATYLVSLKPGGR